MFPAQYFVYKYTYEILCTHTPSVLLLMETLGTPSDSALAQLLTARWAQLLPYRCSHYSSSLRQYAARQTQPCWWCTPFPPGPNRHQSGEPASDPVSLTVRCSSLVHDLAPANPQLLTRGLSKKIQKGEPKRTAGERIYAQAQKSV